MNLFRAFLASCLIWMTVSHASAGHGEKAFPDLSKDDRYYPSIAILHAMGIVLGNESGDINPLGLLNRAELVVIVNRAAKTKKQSSDRNCLQDVREEWFAEDICAAIRLGFVKGYADGFFRPERPVTVGEAAKILANILAGKDFQDLAQALAWLEENGYYLEKMGLNESIRRNEAFARLHRVLTAASSPVMADQQDSEGNLFDPEIDPIKNQIGAGQPVYVEFSEKAYEHFLGKNPMILFFHAPWCPLCRKSDEVLLEILEELEGGVIWFKVDYDTETALKKEYGVTYQDTFIVIDASGEGVLKGNTLGSHPERAQSWMKSALGQ
ncbi:MAG: S-layer homology domain-containing protein [Candidatus Altimarinota bacterium]